MTAPADDYRLIADDPVLLCPVCGRDVIYHQGLDRYFHTDGTTNVNCWVHITRGLP
ncbi:MAG: hypothetical protein ACLP3C_15655 [Mycobacterium sp.]|uniref:hypothetical protein n=1 Tax=Mycobacterium sp. TaxID=1785 RepID=UPI003F996A6C